LPCCSLPAIILLQYPYFSTAALSPSNKFYLADPMGGCGQCFQIQCADTRGGEQALSTALGQQWERTPVDHRLTQHPSRKHVPVPLPRGSLLTVFELQSYKP
jgi:hypothetical protein